jgi:hypothetical protein
MKKKYGKIKNEFENSLEFDLFIIKTNSEWGY